MSGPIAKLEEVSKISEVIADLVFIPNPEQRKTKAAFHTAFSEAPICDLGSLTVAQALQITGDQRLRRWWSLPGFREWFVNADEFRQRAEYLANLALDTIEELLLDPDANPNARIKAAALMIEVCNKLPPRWKQERWHDDTIRKMSPAQLREFVKTHAAPLLVGPADPITVGEGGTCGGGEGKAESEGTEATSEDAERTGGEIPSDSDR